MAPFGEYRWQAAVLLLELTIGFKPTMGFPLPLTRRFLSFTQASQRVSIWRVTSDLNRPLTVWKTDMLPLTPVARHVVENLSNDLSRPVLQGLAEPRAHSPFMVRVRTWQSYINVQHLARPEVADDCGIEPHPRGENVSISSRTQDPA